MAVVASSIPLCALACLATYRYARTKRSLCGADVIAPSPSPSPSSSPDRDLSGALEHPGVHHVHRQPRTRFWTHRVTGASPGAAHPQGACPRSHVFHLILIRHAESSNNVIAEQMSRDPRWGPSPYAPGSAEAREYDRRRSPDPALSDLGERQAAALPQHPYLKEIDLPSLARAGRVLLVSSPMRRAILTSIPLYRSLNTHNTMPLIPALPFICERGGCYRTSPVDGSNVRDAGSSRSTLSSLYGSTHSFSACPKSGWWSQCTSVGDEDDDYFATRLQTAIGWVLQQAITHYRHIVEQHAAQALQAKHTHTDRSMDSNTPSTATATAATTTTTTSPPDVLLMVSHADFLNSLLSALTRIPEESRYVFYSSNTSVHHVEIDLSMYSPSELAQLGDVLDQHMEVRVRVANAKAHKPAPGPAPSPSQSQLQAPAPQAPQASQASQASPAPAPAAGQ